MFKYYHIARPYDHIFQTLYQPVIINLVHKVKEVNIYTYIVYMSCANFELIQNVFIDYLLNNHQWKRRGSRFLI